MRRPRHRPRSSARLSFSLLSALALAALCCVPAFAQAECTDSSCKQYEVEIPTAGGSEAKPGHQSEGSGGAPAGASQVADGKPQGSQSSEGGSEVKGTATPAGKGGDGDGGQGGGGENATASGNGQPQTGIGDEKPVATASGEHASDSGGSSPLVPILIAVAVLAAISIGAVLYRQRRQGGGSGSPVSPKAG